MSYVQPEDSGRRVVGLVVVVLFHALLVYGLVNGLARKIVDVVRQPLETKIIEEAKPPPDKPPPPPPPRLAPPPPPFIPLPDVQVQLPSSMRQNTISAVTNVRPSAPAPVVRQQAAPVRTTAAVVNAKDCEKPEYPSASLRAEETGVVRLAFLIDVDGKVLESKVEKSTGYRRLDEAARTALGLCKFKPATADGKPEKSWARMEYEWKIE